MITVDTRDLRNIENAVLELGEAFGPKEALASLRPSFRKMSQVILSAIVSATPSDTGELANSAKISIKRPNKRVQRSVPQGTVLISEIGYVFPARDMGKFLAIEVGNQYVSAKAPLKRSLNAQFDNAVAAFRASFQEDFNKVAERLRKKHSRR